MKKLDYPTHLNLELTNHCQLDCACCPNRVIKRERGFLSWEVLGKIVEESRGKTKTCHPHGLGEPLLHPELFEMLSYIKNAGIKVWLATNAMLLTEDVSDKLFDIGVDEIILPLWSMKKDTYERLRENVSFDVVMENINTCIQLRSLRKDAETRILLHVVPTDETYNEFEDIKKTYLPLLEDFGTVERKGYSTFAKSVPRLYAGLKVPFNGRCMLPNWNVTTYWNGDVVLCCHDVDGFSKVGNVMETSMKEIWDSPLYEEYRRSIRERDFSCNPFCGRCLKEDNE